MNSETSEEELFHQLSYYTGAHEGADFIHQHAVDAFTSQNADESTKPITLTFALVGLYLMIDKNFTGKEVQKAHIKMAKHQKRWPKFNLPQNRGNIRIQDVLNTPQGSELDNAIRQWCISVWGAYKQSHEQVAKLVSKELWKGKP